MDEKKSASADLLNIAIDSSFESIVTQYFLRASEGRSLIRAEDAALLVYVLHGRLDFNGFATSVRVSAKELLLVPTTSDRRLSYNHTSDAEWYVLRFRDPAGRLLQLCESKEEKVQVRVARPERITDLLRRCLNEQKRQPVTDLIRSHLIELVVYEIRTSKEEGRKFDEQGVFEVIASRVDAHIAAHYHEAISTVEIAEELRYNPEYLERTYRHVCQISIREAILLRRIREARAELLRNRERSVGEIAARCGFNDLSYFRRVFKRMTGSTPRGFRSTRRIELGQADALPHEPASTGAATGHNGRVPSSLRVVEALNAGFFVSCGHGIHPRRVIDSYELIFVTQGCLELYEGDTIFHVRKNQVLLLVPGRVHGGLSSYDPELNFYWVHFRVPTAFSTGTAKRFPKTATITDPGFLTELYCMFITDQESDKLSTESAANLVMLLLCAVRRNNGDEQKGEFRRRKHTEPSTLARAIEDFIDQNFNRPISTRTIAKELNFNSDYLERVHRQYGGVSIVHTLHERRIRAAREDLRNRISKNINEIAFACGYNDAGYFRRVFKRITGLTPKQYRSMFVQTHINTH